MLEIHALTVSCTREEAISLILTFQLSFSIDNHVIVLMLMHPNQNCGIVELNFTQAGNTSFQSTSTGVADSSDRIFPGSHMNTTATTMNAES
jgi:hypothetical protein